MTPFAWKKLTNSLFTLYVAGIKVELNLQPFEQRLFVCLLFSPLKCEINNKANYNSSYLHIGFLALEELEKKDKCVN